jgi:hypothetical protein
LIFLLSFVIIPGYQGQKGKKKIQVVKGPPELGILFFKMPLPHALPSPPLPPTFLEPILP